MKRNAEGVEVGVTESGFVEISQLEPGLGTDRVMLSPDQVDQVIDWLREAKDEASKLRFANKL